MNTKRRKTGARLGALLLSLCLLVGLLPVTAFAADPPTKRDTYNVYSDAAIAGGADSQVYAVTIENVDGADLHYVYSENAIHDNALMEKLREGLSESYKSLVPTFEGADSGTGFLCFSRDQAKYEEMKLNWDDPKAVADALISGSGSVSVAANDSAISVTDISEIHAGEKVVSENQVEDFNEHLSELGQLGTGENRVEAMVGVSFNTEIVEDKEYYDVFNAMHVAQIYAYTATKTASESDPITKTASESDPIDLPVYILKENGLSPNLNSDYDLAPESASFLPDSAKAVNKQMVKDERNERSKVGLFINYHMNCDSSLSEGYDWCALYTVRIPFYYTTAWNVEPEPRSGMLTIPLPEGYDGATARFKYQNSSYFGDVSWSEVSSYTGTTISFPVNEWPKSAGSYSDGNTKTIVRYTSILVEYKAAQEPEAPVIIEGTNGTWQNGSKDGLTFTSNAEFSDFIKVQVDGKDVAASNYTVKEGSTIVTLNPTFLGSLSVGKHTLAIVSTTGTAITEFAITAVQTGNGDDQTEGDQTGGNQTGGDSQTGGTTPQTAGKNEGAVTSPQTGDSSNAVLWIALLFASGAGLFGAAAYSKKKKNNL